MRIFPLLLLSTTLFAASAKAELAVGLGIASVQDPQKGLDAKHIALPLASYRGERLNFQVTTLSDKVVELGDVEINALVSGRIQGYECHR